MMGHTHRVTGLCAGAYVAWGVRVVALPAPSPAHIVLAAVAGALLLTLLTGRAALWPDLDHSNSTATNSYGFLSGAVHEAVERLSIACWEASTTARDRDAGDFRNHRGLTHFAVTAVLLGGVLGAGTWALTSRWPALALGVTAGAVVVAVTPPVLRAAHWLGIARKATRRPLREPLGFIAGAATAWAVTRAVPVTATVELALVGPALGLGVGLAVTVGMLAHSLGDAATLAGVPLLWPLRIRGQRYFPVHIRPRRNLTRTTAGSPTELRLRVVSRVLLVIAVIGWWPGAWPLLWASIPWPVG